MLVLLPLLLASPLAIATKMPNRDGAASDPNDPFGDIEDPSKQCLDINCYEPVAWDDGQEEVCRYRTKSECEPRSQEVCQQVDYEECSLVGYTECTTEETTQDLRDDQVGGEAFIQRTCETNPITIIELKEKPECEKVEKEVCEKMWIPEAPFWKDTNCQVRELDHCEYVPNPLNTTLDYCQCEEEEIWYDRVDKVDVTVPCRKTSCQPKAVQKCETRTRQECVTVEWTECQETCENECYEQHFRKPSQARDHRRWCSHAEIELPAGVPPASGPPELAGSAVLASPSSGSSGSASSPSAPSGNPIPSYSAQPRGGRSQRVGIDNLSAPSTTFPNSAPSFNSINNIIRPFSQSREKRGCVRLGVNYSHGSRWLEACNTYSCDDGVVSSTQHVCNQQ